MPWLLGGYMWLYLHRPFEIWLPLGEIQLERVYMIGVIICWVVGARKNWIANKLQTAFAFFTLVLLASWFASPYPHELGQKIIEDYLKVAVFLALLVTTIKDEQGLRQMLCFYFLALFLYQAHSLLEFINGRYEYRMGTVRMKGVDTTYGDPNTFAANLLHALPFLIPLWMVPTSPRTRKLIAGYVLLTLVCILLTGSRRAFLGLGFLSLLLILRSKHRVALLMGLALLAPAGFAVMPANLQNRFLTIIDSSYGPQNAEGSKLSRWYFFLDGLRLWNQNPLTGVGPAAFGVAAGHGMQAHNLYGQTPGELGTLGVIGLCFTVYCFRRNTTHTLRQYRDHPWIEPDFVYHVVRSSWLAIVLLLFMGLGGHNLYRYNWMWYGAFQIIAVHCARQRFLVAAEEKIEVYELAPRYQYRLA